MRRVHCISAACGLFFATLILTANVLSSERYGAYGLFPQGSHRVMAMGGAYTALSDDATGVTYNPAGLAFQSYWADLGGNYNSVWNREVDLNNDGQKDGLPYGYYYYAATFRTGLWGAGVGFSSPYKVDLPIENDNGAFREKRTLKLSIETFNLPLAYLASNEWSVGINLQGYVATQSYQFTSTNGAAAPVDLASKKERSNVVVGVMYRPLNGRYSFGASHSPRVEFSMDSTLNGQTGGVNWFRDIVIPSKTTVGMSYRERRWLYSFDLDYFEGLQNTVYVGSQLIPQFKRVEFDEQPKLVLHGGFEWNAVSNRFWDWYLRGGTYNEPPRIKGNPSRQHYTLGSEVRYWLFSVSLAFDGADDFANAAAGFGVSLKYYL